MERAMRRASPGLAIRGGAGLLGLALACCGGASTSSAVGPPQLDPDMPRVAPPAVEDQTCSMDLECALVQDCCGCRGGGRLLAVRSDRVEDLEGRARSECSSRCAAAAEGTHRSCSATEAVCRGGRCIPRLQPTSPPPAE